MAILEMFFEYSLEYNTEISSYAVSVLSVAMTQHQESLGKASGSRDFMVTWALPLDLR